MDNKKILNIVKEEIRNFAINEIADDEIIKFGEINLSNEYDKLNKQLFNSELPSVPMKWSNRKGNLGHVQAMRNRFTGEIKIMHLAISSFHAMPYRVFRDTMAHEMIHVKQLAVNKEPGSHGWSFLREADRINKMGLGYNITVRSKEQLSISDKVKGSGKELIAIILEIDGNFYVSVTTPTVFASDGNYIFNLFERVVQNGRFNSVEINAIETTNPQLLKYPLKRTYRKGISYTKLSDTLLDELLHDRIIKTVRLKRGSPAVMSEQDDAGAWEEFIII